MANNLTLSRLAYECIRDAIVLPYSDFDYDKFTRGEYRSDSRYTMQNNMVFNAINKAMARLTEYDKLPLRNDSLQVFIDLDINKKFIALPQRCGVLKNVYIHKNSDYETIPYREDTITYVGNITNDSFKYNPISNKLEIAVDKFDELGLEIDTPYSAYDEQYVSSVEKLSKRDKTFIIVKDLDNGENIIGYHIEFISGGKDKNIKYLIEFNVYSRRVYLEKNISSDEAFIEYVNDIPHFTESDIVPTIKIFDNGSNRYKDNNISLVEYGITNSIFMFIKEFVNAQMLAIVDPSSSKYQEQVAEQYFNDLPIYHVAHQQNKVSNDIELE